MNKKRLLIIGPAWVGDMVMAQSLFMLLQQQEAVDISVLAPVWSGALVERMPEVTSFIPMPIGHGQLHLKQRYQVARSLRRHNFTEAYILPNSFKSALIPYWAGIPVRVGWLGEMRFGLLNDIRYLDKKRYPLMVERFAALAYPAKTSKTPYPHPHFHVTNTSLQSSLNKFKISFPTKPILALCPGAKYGPSKRWPTEYYQTVATTKIKQGWQIWIFGAADEKNSAAQITASLPAEYQDFTGRTTLGETIDLLSLANAIISHDSGLMHIAAALQRPLIALYGSSSPHFTPPLSPKAQILQHGQLSCAPCFKRTCPLQHHHCMTQLPPERVLAALTNLETLCASS